MPDAGEEVLAFPDTQARRLAGVSMRRLRYWEQVGLIVPSIKRRLSDHNTVRLYSYQDLLALLVVSALRTERDMSLQTIRRVVRHLRSRGYDEPLRELRFATVGREIYFQHPGWSVAVRTLLAEGEADGEACHGEQSESSRTSRKEPPRDSR